MPAEAHCSRPLRPAFARSEVDRAPVRAKRLLRSLAEAAFSACKAPDSACFSLTPGTVSVILKSLRGVVPAVPIVPGPCLWMAPERDQLRQAKGC